MHTWYCTSIYLSYTPRSSRIGCHRLISLLKCLFVCFGWRKLQYVPYSHCVCTYICIFTNRTLWSLLSWTENFTKVCQAMHFCIRSILILTYIHVLSVVNIAFLFGFRTWITSTPSIHPLSRTWREKKWKRKTSGWNRTSSPLRTEPNWWVKDIFNRENPTYLLCWQPQHIFSSCAGSDKFAVMHWNQFRVWENEISVPYPNIWTWTEYIWHRFCTRNKEIQGSLNVPISQGALSNIMNWKK